MRPIHVSLPFPLFAVYLLIAALALPPSPVFAGGVEDEIALSLDTYRAGSFEAALEGLETSTLALSRELMARANAEPVAITKARFVQPADTGETTLDVPAVAERPGEFFLRVDIAGLDREERRGRFRHHLRHTVKIVDPDGRALLEETPVDRRSDFGPYVTSLHVIDRIPVPPEWVAGRYVAEVVVEDGLCLDPAKARAENKIPFEVRPAPVPASDK